MPRIRDGCPEDARGRIGALRDGPRGQRGGRQGSRVQRDGLRECSRENGAPRDSRQQEPGPRDASRGRRDAPCREQAYVPRDHIRHVPRECRGIYREQKTCRHGRLPCADRMLFLAVPFRRSRARRQCSPEALRIRRYKTRLSGVLRRFRYKRKECRK